jgi:ABC-2 type transport system ATP-binding protein
VAEIISRSGLFTYTIEGDGARQLVAHLKGHPGVVFIAFFGAVLHVSGYDRALLEAALAPYRGDANLKIEEAPPSLEDVFIQLQENNGEGAR